MCQQTTHQNQYPIFLWWRNWTALASRWFRNPFQEFATCGWIQATSDKYADYMSEQSRIRKKKSNLKNNSILSYLEQTGYYSGHRRSKNIPGSTCVVPSITVIQISNDQLSFFNQILCTWQELSALEAPFDGRERIAPNRTIKCRIFSLVSGLFYRGQHHLWCRYRFSRPSRRSRHALWLGSCRLC